MMDSIVEFAKYGVWGVMVLLVALVAYLSNLFYKVVTNHNEHSMQTTRESSEAIRDNTEVLTEVRDVTGR